MIEINSERLCKLLKCIKERKLENEAKKLEEESVVKRKLEGYVQYPIKNWDSYLERSKKEFLKRYVLPYKPPIFLKSEFSLLCTIAISDKARVLLGAWNGKFITKKVIEKKYLVDNNLVDKIKEEIRFYKSFKFPFISKTYFVQDHVYLYFIRSFCCGGDLEWFIGTKGMLSEEEARFFVSQIVLCLEYLHTLGIVHRNVTPSSILIAHDGYIRLINFSYARFAPTRGVSRLEAASPEMLKGRDYGCSHDCWSLGTMLFLLLTGKQPFLGANEEETLLKTMCRCMCMPLNLSDEAFELLRLLLVVDPELRLGSYCPSQIKCHRWFASVPWIRFANKQLTPPFVPDCTSNPVRYCQSFPLEPLDKASFDKYDPLFNNF